MKIFYSLLNVFKFEIIFLLNFIPNLSSERVIREEGQEWIKINDVVYKGPKYVKEGQTFEILCLMSRFNGPKWTRNELSISDSDERISFGNKIGFEMTRIETISVTNALPQDSGSYRCNSFSRAYHELYIIPSTPIPSLTTESSLVSKFFEIREEYSSVVLKCDINYDLENRDILWFRNGLRILNDERRMTQDLDLLIKNATNADAGEYLCRIDSISARGGSQIGQIVQLRAPIKVKAFPKTQSIVVGQSYRLECNYTGYPFGRIQWLIGNEKLISEDLSQLGVEIHPNPDSHPDSVLIIRNTTQKNSNSYTCIVDNMYTKDESSVIITVRENGILTNGPLIIIENKPLHLFCNYTNDRQYPEQPLWKWSKGGINLNAFSEEDKQRMTIEKDFSLLINKANKNDVGDWRCDSPNNYDVYGILKVRTKPWLHLFDEYHKTNYKSANVVEGEPFHLRCEVMDEYNMDAEVGWFRYNESVHQQVLTGDVTQPLTPIQTNDQHIRLEVFNKTLITLTIDKVMPSDRYYYVCKADNGITTTNNTILLRVKDKLGALWPFLGIVAEVVILCTIIFIYEKRRIKPDFDESDDNNTTEPKESHDRSDKPQDVRQRK